METAESRAGKIARPYWGHFKVRHERRIETVDILASVNEDPGALGPPVIAAAIKHWQKILYWKNVHERKSRVKPPRSRGT